MEEGFLLIFHWKHHAMSQPSSTLGTEASSRLSQRRPDDTNLLKGRGGCAHREGADHLLLGVVGDPG